MKFEAHPFSKFMGHLVEIAVNEVGLPSPSCKGGRSLVTPDATKPLLGVLNYICWEIHRCVVGDGDMELVFGGLSEMTSLCHSYGELLSFGCCDLFQLKWKLIRVPQVAPSLCPEFLSWWLSCLRAS